MNGPGPIETAPLFAPLHGELIGLLRSLADDEWLRPTAAGRWRVRDVAAHLLDGDLRHVAAYRDGHLLPLDAPIASPADLARLVNHLNATGVAHAARLSPRQIVDLLEISGQWVIDLVSGLPPHGMALWAVSWAGEDASENWMDVGRQYTERWHHQMQIRDAVGRPLLLEPQWLEPLLDLSMRALPVAYRDSAAALGTSIEIVVTDHPGGVWTLRRGASAWVLERGGAPGPLSTVRASADQMWRLLYNGLPAERARQLLEISGDRSLAAPLLGARSVIL